MKQVSSPLVGTVGFSEPNFMTCRWIILMRGRRWLASTISIFEQLLYVWALGLVVVGLNNPLRAVAYAVGYGVGSVVGSWVEERIAVGFVVFHVVTAVDSSLASVLRSAKIAVTSWIGDGLDGNRQVLMVASRRKSIQYTMDLIQQTDPRAFCDPH